MEWGSSKDLRFRVLMSDSSQLGLTEMPASRTAWPHWRVRGGPLAEVPQEKERTAGLACGAVEGSPAAPTEWKGQFSVARGDGEAGGGDVLPVSCACESAP